MIVKKIQTGDIKDDLLERMLKDTTFDKDGIPQTVGEDVAM